ncbi:MAG: hypothetical protein HYZ45_01220 [Burkholderiales bacterium]|nr:hypothetical protein [Burkholderiales bacterium]
MNLEARKTDSSLFESFFAVCILIGGIATAHADPVPPAASDARATDKALRFELRSDRAAMLDNKAIEERRRLANVLDSRNEANKRPNRLTPDERRDLRRHINQAGQDLYSNIPKD